MRILTFDIEEWFHLLDHKDVQDSSSWSKFEFRLENNLERILNLLKNKNQKATFFCLGWVARKFPNLVEMIDQMGFEIGTHSNMHTLAYMQNKTDFRNDLAKSIDYIGNLRTKKLNITVPQGFELKNQINCYLTF